jgi:hypothetical protein
MCIDDAPFTGVWERAWRHDVDSVASVLHLYRGAGVASIALPTTSGV